METRFFTVAEARQLLPKIRLWISQAIVLSQELEGFSEAVKKLGEDSSVNRGSPEGTAFVEYLIAVQRCLSKVQETGCLVKSVKHGLVDFPHLKDGREVYLCWKYPEEDIEYWHETDAGFAGRTPLSQSE